MAEFDSKTRAYIHAKFDLLVTMTRDTRALMSERAKVAYYHERAMSYMCPRTRRTGLDRDRA